MDEVDLKIMRELKKDAGKSFLKIAKQLGISPKTVQARYQKMIEKGVIWHSTVSINLSKIGYQGKAYRMVTNAANQDATLTVKALNRMNDIFIVSETIGDFDVLAIALVRNMKSFAKLVQNVKTLPSVSQVDFVIVTDTSFPVDKSYDKLPLQLPKP